MIRKFYRAVIIGCGQIAGGYDEHAAPGSISTHIKAYLDRKDIEVVGVADTNLARARSFARRWGIRSAYRSTEELLSRARPDLVSICTTSESHMDTLKSCLNFPLKGIWCEKPLSIKTEAVRLLVKRFRSRGIPVLVNYMRRWMDQVNYVRSKFEKDSMGDVLKVVGTYTKGLRHNGSHTIDLWRYWFGEPRSIVTLRRTRDRAPHDKVIDACLYFDRNVSAFLLGLGDPGYNFWEVDILTTQARVKFRDSGNNVDWVNLKRPLVQPHSKTVQSNLKTVMRLVLDNLISAIRYKRPLLSDAESGLQTLEICNRLITQPIGMR